MSRRSSRVSKTAEQLQEENTDELYNELEKNYSVERAIELGCIVVNDDGDIQRPRVLWYGTCGRLCENKQLCKKAGTVVTSVRDLEDNKDLQHKTCPEHQHNTVLDKKGKPTKEVMVSYTGPAIYYEVSTDNGKSWGASGRLDDEELDHGPSR